MHQIKAQKLDQLIGPQITSDSSPENLKTVVTIPENLLLSDSEKLFLSTGLNFVPISEKKKTTNLKLSKTLKNPFPAFTKFSNLSSEEWSALKSLKKRKDIVIKAADKGGAVVVWRADLYQKEALRQLSDTSFYA